MESMQEKWARDGTSIHSDKQMRYSHRRPAQPFEDLGSDFKQGARTAAKKGSSSQNSVKSSSQQKSKGSLPRRNALRSGDSDSEDELLLSSDRESSVDPVERRGERKIAKEKKMEQKEKPKGDDIVQKLQKQSGVLKGLSFKKRKGAESDDKSSLKENEATSSTSKDSPFEESSPTLSCKPASSTILKPVPPKDPNVHQPPSNDPTKTPIPSKMTRSSSRRNASKDATSDVQRVGKAVARQTSLKKTQSVIISDSSEDEDSPEPSTTAKVKGKVMHRIVSPSGSPEPKKRTIEAFPSLSPLSSTPVKGQPAKENATRGFPLLSPLSSQDTAEDIERTIGKGKGKAAGNKPSSNGTTPRPMPLPSPLSSQNVRNRPTGKEKRRGAGRSNDTVEDRVSRTKPFPLSLPGSDGPNSGAGPSTVKRPEKRIPDEPAVGSAERAKRRKEEASQPSTSDSEVNLVEDMDADEDYDLFFNSDVDPRTLCPYCDARLPRSPTPLLKKLITRAAEKSQPHPRPTNSLGRKAPMAVFISVCQRHRFENEILPEAESKGWPKTIDFDQLEKRVIKMKNPLKELIDDETWKDQMDEDEIAFYDHISPRSLCVFWKEALQDVKEKGSKVAANVKSQFSNFEKTQPGYYGELGSVIIHHALYELFPPSSIEPHLVAPLDPKEFIQRVLVPEVGVRLIMEDKKLIGGAGAREAVQILRDSSKYGVAMFPEDGGEWDDSSRGRKQKENGQSGLNAADAMVREKARKRRIEIAEEDRIEEKELEMAKEAEKYSRQSEAKADDPTVTTKKASRPEPRPRPKAIRKNSSTVAVDAAQASEAETDTTPHDEDDEDAMQYVDLEERKLFAELDDILDRDADSGFTSFLSRPSRAPSTENSSEPSTKTKRKARAAAEKAKAAIATDNSGEDTDVSMTSTRSRQGKRLEKRQRRPESREVSVEVVPPPTSSLKLDDDDDATPRPTRRQVQASSSIPALVARERLNKLGRTNQEPKPRDEWMNTMRKDPVSPSSWLLSDD
ncbi:proteophosphoglycan ppg4 [Moniliophthora roreri MCA 2997]|uniref:Restriction of telomere capping protein 4 n=2 Tax=Moniliophthora roreri TaxID=221103 RepID=V2X3M5_MONRO|nr:proteophosphoglycan ppg4 [Moniliophthora roreri MCA 2997]KAI3619612.1 proteophosphoglycan ppg4 [Moniliophthora roreri]